LFGIVPLSVGLTTALPALDPTLQPQTTHKITIATIARVHRIPLRMTPSFLESMAVPVSGKLQ
jgi:hypothetical protein